jgi:DNA-directed RNA polymerase sigma subunit (sigma70/sigma32)
MNMEEIGELFGISAERVRQIKKKALDMLREDYSKELSNILYGTA